MINQSDIDQQTSYVSEVSTHLEASRNELQLQLNQLVSDNPGVNFAPLSTAIGTLDAVEDAIGRIQPIGQVPDTRSADEPATAPTPSTAGGPGEIEDTDRLTGEALAETLAEQPANVGTEVPLYTYDDADNGEPIPEGWPDSGLVTPDGKKLFHSAADKPGSPPAGDGSDGLWHLYTGDTEPAPIPPSGEGGATPAAN